MTGPSAPDPVTFQPEVALAYARELAYPRRVGSPGEARAIESLAARLAEAGCVVERQPFTFSTGAQVATTLEIFFAQCLILLTFWAWSLSAAAGLVPALLLLGLLASTARVQRRVAAGSIAPPPGQAPSAWQRFCLRLGKRQQTVNLVARYPARAEAAKRPSIFLVAHSDSKSQVMPLVARMLFIALSGGAAVLFALLTLLRPLWPEVTSAAAVTGLVALVAGVPVLFLFLAGAGNASPGAIDNASGAGLVLHLAEVLAAGDRGLDVNFLITGAEELGVVGATAYVLAEQQAGRWPAGAANSVSVLNFDGIGTAGHLAVVGGGAGSRLGELVRACCVDLQLPLGRLPLIGAMFDHIPFAEAGCEALSLVTVSAAGRSVHTPADTADKLHVEGFRQAGEVALAVIERLGRKK